ncbi:multifunctional ribose 5-phosphate isomerase B/3-demethylubiquinone-9 3-methyltransferase/2-octaprenyl-6-hydroxy phenol methylase [Wolbachia pipientis]|uniref:Ubiquinone biosynthesis O-methyltransferase n=1 Tax=Wolbachia pipientis TaxID=955 RepID=A0A1E7QJT2_WOLPI|nr:bifunctional 2-polyprenyl-6-hydroxyphenol methylase/3-demethylubiquinol 3-O-methyltransferase UbiG [Wolbachia pipientis]OEY86647.1 multifunctional ribose 5-phosphate isomerase B/3-demethylubiquinone-9 3-methyltransferase/2-octaprenyl-6-hydroxy phenol methylase [Wolbachia pipientis]
MTHTTIVSIASDHAGFELKSEIVPYLRALGYAVIEHGCTADQECVDYTDYAIKVLADIANKKAAYGILICGTGLGMNIAANRLKAVRAVSCNNIEIAKLAREHNNANVLCLGARLIATELARDIVINFLETEFSQEPRHTKRVNKLNDINEKTYNESEISKFAKIADDWWNQNGKFKMLHMINPIRGSYIIEKIKEFKQCDLKEILLLDVGCGGGILSEMTTRVGINTVGIDICEKNIKIAQSHAEKMGLNIEYIHTSIEQFNDNKKYDIILLMEIVEHVDNLDFFVSRTLELLKPEGLVFISTINRTIKSFLLAIIGAEYILNWVPRGTHNWKKFLKPSEIANLFRQNNIMLQDMVGMEYNVIKNEWKLTKNVDVNYIICGQLA